ncbi:MFS transporter [Phenylobacterium sp.]|uniref:MFS transporter n=1 Tax=Phenylobacterium sp. TaxID=1871053 RepID=UPI0027345B2A|nr:MFS transporter [Phenylobacterium sp.]MDP3853461.1 MFS transporter [Phenylobacterium sp.]
MTATATIIDRPPLSLATKLLYGVGSVASAVKLRSLSTFLMIFYNQVVGLPPAMVSLVLMCALIFDAIVDPLIGQISDNFKSKLGRRHPFMYAAAVPFSLAFFLLWNPPVGWSDEALVGYLLACLLTLRFFDTFFELPHSALAPELAKDYNERTSLISIRMLFAVIGGLGMTVMAYQVFLKENPDGSGGVLARDGYFAYSLTAAILVFTAILVSTRGTQNQIPYLRKAPTRKITLPAMAREVAHTLNNRAFVVATLTGMCIAIAAGSRNGLEIYFGLYFWELKQSQLALLSMITVAGAATGVLLAPLVAKRLGKKYGAITLFASALLVGISPVIARLMGVMPPNGTDLLFGLLVVETVINTALAAGTGVILVSLVADVIEDAEVKTGRRSEGLLLSADNLFKKIVSGVGVFIAGSILAFINFPENAKRGAVDPEVIHNLGMIYIPTVGLLYGLGICCLFAFNIDRAKHEDNLRRLRETAEQAGVVEEAASSTSIAGGVAPLGSKA